MAGKKARNPCAYDLSRGYQRGIDYTGGGIKLVMNPDKQAFKGKKDHGPGKAGAMENKRFGRRSPYVTV